MKICILTLGCKVNQYESSIIAEKLRAHGHEIVEKLEQADLYIVNTCAVTGFAEKKSRYEVSRILRLESSARIIVCGCASQLNALQFKSPNVTGIFGCDKAEIANRIIAQLGSQAESGTSSETSQFVRKHNKQFFIKVQDGCNNFCSYCIVPYLRGRSRSRNIEDIIAEIRSRADGREVVLTGIDLSSYGLDKNINLAELCIAVDGCGLPFHLSSLEVRIITPEFLNALSACKNFRPHFHLSLQSGSDKVLVAMNRHYTTAEYYEKICLIRACFQAAKITTDIICGFPTETEENFRESCDFVKKVGFDDIHIFPYSARSGTPAAKLPQVQAGVITRRTKELSDLI